MHVNGITNLIIKNQVWGSECFPDCQLLLHDLQGPMYLMYLWWSMDFDFLKCLEKNYCKTTAKDIIRFHPILPAQQQLQKNLIYLRVKKEDCAAPQLIRSGGFLFLLTLGTFESSKHQVWLKDSAPAKVWVDEWVTTAVTLSFLINFFESDICKLGRERRVQWVHIGKWIVFM